LSNATVERGFSKMNLIKTDLRNCISDFHLDCLMMISLNGPEIEHYFAEKAIEIFKNMKKRRKI